MGNDVDVTRSWMSAAPAAGEAFADGEDGAGRACDPSRRVPRSGGDAAPAGRWRLGATWPRDGARYVVREPDAVDLERHAPALAAWYGDAHVQAMMTMDPAPISAERIREIHGGLQARGGRTFLLFRDDTLVGDADLRRIERDRAELAILIGPRGCGLGTTLSILLGALAFRALGVRELYLSVIPENHAARRCYEKVGYRIDHGPLARSYADSDEDIVMVLTPEALRARHGESLDAIEWAILRLEPGALSPASSPSSSPLPPTPHGEAATDANLRAHRLL